MAHILRRPRWRWRIALASICAAGAIATVWMGSLAMRAQHRGPPLDCDSCWPFLFERNSPEVRLLAQDTTFLYPLKPVPSHALLSDPALPIELYYLEGWLVILTGQRNQVARRNQTFREITLDYTSLTISELAHAGGIVLPVRAGVPGRKGAYLVAAWLPPFALLTLIGLLPLASGSVRALRMRRRHRHGRCACCGYPLIGLPEQRCPECGTSVRLPFRMCHSGSETRVRAQHNTLTSHNLHLHHPAERRVHTPA